MRNGLLPITLFVLITLTAVVQMEIVEIEKPQVAKSVAGVIYDPSGAALSGVTVEERTEDWRTVLRSVQTDENGKFHFSNGKDRDVYYLQFSRSGFNWLRIRLKLVKKAKPSIVVKMPIGT